MVKLYNKGINKDFLLSVLMKKYYPDIKYPSILNQIEKSSDGSGENSEVKV